MFLNYSKQYIYFCFLFTKGDIAHFTEVTVPFGRIFFRLVTIEINSAIANNPKPIGMMKMQCVGPCFPLYEESSRLFPNILRTLCERSKIAEDQ